MGAPVNHSSPQSSPGPAPATRVAAAVAPATHCVLWHQPDVAPPPELLANLASKQIRVCVSADPYDATARVVRLERLNDAAAQGSPGPRDAVILLMIRPDNLPLSAEVFHAVQQFAPRTACWQFDLRANPVLRPVVEEHVRSWPGCDASRRSCITPAPPTPPPGRAGTTPDRAGSPQSPAPSTGTVRPPAIPDIRVRTRTMDDAKNT